MFSISFANHWFKKKKVIVIDEGKIREKFLKTIFKKIVKTIILKNHILSQNHPIKITQKKRCSNSRLFKK